MKKSRYTLAAIAAMCVNLENLNAATWQQKLALRESDANNNLSSRIARDTANQVARQALSLQRMSDDLLFQRGMQAIQRSLNDARQRINSSQQDMDQRMNDVALLIDDMNGLLVDIQGTKESMISANADDLERLREKMNQLQLQFINSNARLALVAAN